MAPFKISTLLSRVFCAAAATVCVGAATPASGALLVYEGFNGYGATGTLFGRPQPNANTVGLNKQMSEAQSSPAGTGGYRDTGWRNAEGLTFGNLQTSGGSVAYTTSTQSYLSARLDLNGDGNVSGSTAAAYTGTLYSSYLVNISTLAGTAAGDGIQVRVSGSFEGTGEVRYISSADNRTSTSTTTDPRHNHIGLSYAQTQSFGGVSLAQDTTYLIVNRFTNVGTTISGSNPGVATMFVLTQSQFATLTQQADWEAYLDVNASDTSKVTGYINQSSNVGTNNTFDDTDYLHFLAAGAGGRFDEFRYGSTLQSVLPVPEPGKGLLLTLGAMALVTRRRRVK